MPVVRPISVAKNKSNKENGVKRPPKFSLSARTKQAIAGIIVILLGIIIGLSFFDKAGVAGRGLANGIRLFIGDTVFIIPLILIAGGIALLDIKRTIKEKKLYLPTGLAVFLLVFGISGVLGVFDSKNKRGGWLGSALSWPLLNYFGFWASFFILLAVIIIGIIIFWNILSPKREDLDDGEVEGAATGMEDQKMEKTKGSIIGKFFTPKFKVKEIFPKSSIEEKTEEKSAIPLKAETKTAPLLASASQYKAPPLDLLEKEHGVPTSGDTKVNSAIIKKTLLNFGIDVSMSEVNIGPTVTQYTLKPAEGVKLSKITGLSNDLSLALAAHPIRIEAPVPGKALVGVEIPNKVRAQVRLRDLVENPAFQKSTANLILPLGKDVSGFPIYTDLTKMPHMLVAGSTGTGKTIFLHTLITSLLYQPSSGAKTAGPEFLRLVLVDPKRVEFPVFSNLPHLLCPVIYNASQTFLALKWLTLEMERRFEVLAEARCRDIAGYNELAIKDDFEPLPFIVVVIDELADLMAAKGREIEGAIVRLAQMARAVGIHLVVATQRPSVEVITGLIKANITSRITFQVASQVDSRTVIDSSGAEKLLGAGDMLYISAQVPKPKRVQAPYISEKEVKRVVGFITKENSGLSDVKMNEDLMGILDRGTEEPEKETEPRFDMSSPENDPMFEEAKKVVIESKKASASLLQRRLRLGYARAARLIDMLEEKGVIGPGEGAKPREVYGTSDDSQAKLVLDDSVGAGKPENTEDGWKKI